MGKRLGGNMKRPAILYASVVAALVLAVNCASAKGINYNASKSNTGNRTAHNTGNGNGQPSMAVKNGGVPQNTATKGSPSSHKNEQEPSHMEMPNFGR
jgi:hypothetical protein